MLSSMVGASTDSTAGVVSTEGGGVSLRLAVVALGAPAVCGIVIQLTFSVADNEILATNASLFDIACKRHHYCRICLVFTSFSSSQSTRRLALDDLRVVGGDAVRDFGQREMGRYAM